MKVNIKELTSCKKLLQIEVAPEVAAARLEEVSKDFKKAVKIPGFRQGKVPRHILEMHYKDQIREEMLKRLIPDSYRQAMKENSLIPMELPEISEVEFKQGSPLLFKAAVEVKPLIKLGSYLGLKIRKRKKEVTDKDLEETLKQLQQASSRARKEQIPVLNDEFARSLGGFKGLDELKAAIKKDLIARAEAQAKVDLENQVIEHLLKISKFSVPECLVRRQAERLVKEAKMQLAYKGIKAEEIEKQEESLRKSLEEKAVRQAKTALILEDISALEKIKANEQEIEQKVVQMAGEAGRQPEELKAWLIKEGLLDNLKGGIKTAKTLSFLIEKANINC
ncbi:MAG: trigger factor [Candidatus Omnitrophota bacterium]|nr:trigger factor [Candidatus Omnitrophota bacterium]